eukprot:jgi/Psemu1/28783/gm1.28783_g
MAWLGIMSSSSDSISAFDIYTLKELQRMLTDPKLRTKSANKIETEVLTRLSTKSQNGSPIGTLMTPSKQQNILDPIGEAEKALSNINNALSCSEKISNDCAAAITRLSECTTLVEQLKQQTMRKRPASSKTTLEFSPTPKQTKEQINVESDESDEDLNQKTASKPKYKKHNNFSKDKSAAYMKNESQNFTKHRFHNLEPGVAITKIVETHADVVTKEWGLDYFMTKFPNMKKLDIDLCGLITSQPGEGTFKHNPYNNAIAVFLVKGQPDQQPASTLKDVKRAVACGALEQTNTRAVSLKEETKDPNHGGRLHRGSRSRKTSKGKGLDNSSKRIAQVGIS